MPTGSNLKIRGGVYYARLKVPRELNHLMGVAELSRSLETKDRRTANVRKLAVLSEWHQKFDTLRRRREMSEADFAKATWEHYAEELRTDELTRTLPDLANATRHLGSREHHLRALRQHLGRGETALIEWAADAFIEKHRLLTQHGSAQYRELCFRLMRAQIEVLMRAGERDLGNYAGLPADPVVTRPAATAEVAKPGERLMELFERYAKENPKRVTKANLDDTRKDMGTFIDMMGADFPVSKLDKKAAREWKGMLARYPVRAKDRTIFKGLSFREIIDANERLPSPIPSISPKTINSYMAGFGGFCNWLAAHDYIAANPFQGMYLSVDKPLKCSFRNDGFAFAHAHGDALFGSLGVHTGFLIDGFDRGDPRARMDRAATKGDFGDGEGVELAPAGRQRVKTIGLESNGKTLHAPAAQQFASITRWANALDKETPLYLKAGVGFGIAFPNAHNLRLVVFHDDGQCGRQGECALFDHVANLIGRAKGPCQADDGASVIDADFGLDFEPRSHRHHPARG